MNEQHSQNVRRLTKWGTIATLAVALCWSIGLINKGVRQLSDQSATASSRIERDPAKDFDSVADITTGVFYYSGSPAWAPIGLVVNSEIQAERPEFQLRYLQPTSEAPGSSTGVRMLIEGKLTFAQSSQPLSPDETQFASAKGIQLKQTPAAIDGIAIAVHPSLNISGLTVGQLADIYSGKIVNWKEVGGPDLEIIPYSLPIGTGELFSENVLARDRLGGNVRFIQTTTQALREIAETPGGIFYASAPAIVSQCKIKLAAIANKSGEYISPYQNAYIPPEKCPQQRNKLNVRAFQTAKYPLTRYLYVTTVQNGGVEERVGQNYIDLLLSDQGQQLIMEAGFISIR
jgi:phosphate transport system substrate-binding protein